MFDINKFLEYREKRVELQNSLLESYKMPLIAVRTNYPGEDKLEPLAVAIADIAASEMEALFKEKIVHRKLLENLEGKIYLFVIDKKAIDIKKSTVHFEENHILGRCLDIDVYDVDGTSLSRSIFGYDKRKCLICEDMAFICGRTMKHSHQEIKNALMKKYIAYNKYISQREKIVKELGDLALTSMIYEVSAAPSFGLVSPLTKGSHEDMDFFTFLKSSFAIKDGFEKMAEIAYSYLSLEEVFNQSRKIGIEVEKKMFVATDNVNTHKGMIFLLGTVVIAAARVIYENKNFEDIQSLIKNMCRDILKDFENISNKKELTHGERLYLNYGFTGIRGEVKDGLEVVFNGSLSILENSLKSNPDFNLAFVQTLIFLMSQVMDSTIVHRHDIHMLHRVKEEAKTFIENGGIYHKKGIEMALNLEKLYIKERISPGGSADLLAVTIFLYFFKNKFFNEEIQKKII